MESGIKGVVILFWHQKFEIEAFFFIPCILHEPIEDYSLILMINAQWFVGRKMGEKGLQEICISIHCLVVLPKLTVFQQPGMCPLEPSIGFRIKCTSLCEEEGCCWWLTQPQHSSIWESLTLVRLHSSLPEVLMFPEASVAFSSYTFLPLADFICKYRNAICV